MKTFSLILVLFLVGCTSVASKVVGDQTYDPKPSDYSMLVFINPDAPPNGTQTEDDYLKEWGGPFLQANELDREFDIIGKAGSGGAPLASKKRLLNNVLDQARNLGADAIVITRIGYMMETSSRGTVGKPLVRANAIRFRED